MKPVTWHPARELEDVLNHLHRVAHRTHSHGDSVGQEVMTRADWVPVVDICETAQEYIIKAELPEVKKKDVKVSINAGVLLIQGQRDLAEAEEYKYHRVERAYGTFARSFTLPDDVEEEQIKAEHKDGMLCLHLPKHKEPPPKSVEIKVH